MNVITLEGYQSITYEIIKNDRAIGKHIISTLKLETTWYF
jgi:hypothetical protein